MAKGPGLYTEIGKKARGDSLSLSLSHSILYLSLYIKAHVLTFSNIYSCEVCIHIF